RSFARFPQRRVNDVRIAWIDLHIACADVLVAMQNLFECFAAIERSINAPFCVRPVRMTGYRNENAIGFFWIDRELRDLLTIAQSEMHPGLAGVDRFINAVPNRQVRAMQSFAASDINDIW